MRLASLALLASLMLAPGCVGVVLVPPAVGMVGGLAVGSSSCKRHNSCTSYGLVGAAIGVAFDIVLMFIASSTNDEGD